MEIQQLKGFYYSAKMGSLTKAAEKLSVTQSAVSQQIRSLEVELGVQLFNRIGPRKELTPDGEIFLNLISNIIQDMDSLKTMFEDQKGSQSGLLTLAATTLMIMDVLPGIVKTFIKDYPHIRITILERRWDEVVSLMQSGDIDFGIGPIRSIPSNIDFIEIKAFERVLITSMDHPLTQKRNVTLEDITKYPMITYEKGLITRGEIDRVFKEANLDVGMIMEATNAETIKRYVETGIGVAIIPKIALFPTQIHRLKAINVNRYFGKLHYGIILRKGKYLTSWAKNFLYLLDPALEEQL
jgi:DNA-binding transcriptional LysR family regulator